MGPPLAAREEFPAFPGQPYSIQLDFMRSLYRSLTEGGIGLFESPTGTGKTLSLITGCLHWLEDHRQNSVLDASNGDEPGTNAASLPAWILEQEREQQIQSTATDGERQKRIQDVRTRMLAHSSQPPRSQSSPGDTGDESDSEHLLEEPTLTHARLELSDSEEEEGTDANKENVLFPGKKSSPRKMQVIFCSRTHSQLSQVVGELIRTRFASLFSLVALGSRSTLCINDAVRRGGDASIINERCMDLQKPKASKKRDAGGKSRSTGGGRCPFLVRSGKPFDTMQDTILASPMDIEDLGNLGKRRGICPYYAGRDALPMADIILAPYSALLLEETRDALGLSLDGNIIIVDEAHNLVDAVNGVHSATVTQEQVTTATRQLEQYLHRYSSRLGPASCLALQQLLLIAGALKKMMHGEPRAITLNQFTFDSGLEGINVFQLLRMCTETKLVFKVVGHAKSLAVKQLLLKEGSGSITKGSPHDNDASPPSSLLDGASGPLQGILSFLRGLRDADEDGRIIISNDSVKYCLLNPGKHFSKVVAKAHAVVLASGTLSPLGPVLSLFPQTPLNEMHRFSCGHVVGKDRLLALALGRGPTGAPLDFRFSQRQSMDVLANLGQVLLNVSQIVPGGTVAFFPSYQYLEQAVERWKTTGFWARLNRIIPVFLEPRSAGQVDSVLETYALAIRSTRGAVTSQAKATSVLQESNRSTDPGKSTNESTSKASSPTLLLAVVGGRLAEGINFGDELGRCIVMVGLPYPSPSDPELVERLRFIDRACRHGSGQSGGLPASREHYQDLCMRAVNQSIGRAIRHSRDYAAILLLDTRYVDGLKGGFSGPMAKLPGWMRPAVEVINEGQFGPSYARIAQFFKAKAAENAVM